MGTAIDYEHWARTYDDTRALSPSVLNPVLGALGPPNGRMLLDIGGGTGNFAVALSDAGFRVTLCDFSPEMTRRAAAKVWEPVLIATGDAQRLPFGDGTFDCAIAINVLGHVPEWRYSLHEARRVLMTGPLVIKLSTEETLRANWLMKYFPTILDHAPSHHYRPDREVIEALRAAGFPRVEIRRVHYTDVVDGSFQALKHYPEALFEERRLSNTAVFKRLPREDIEAGLESLRRDLEAGRLDEVVRQHAPIARKYGDGTVFVAHTSGNPV